MSLDSTPFVRQIRTYVEDTRKRVMLFDDFENAPLDWQPDGGVDGDFVVERVTTKKRDGAASMRIATPTTTPAEDDYVAASRYIGMTGNLGILETTADIVAHADPVTFQFDLDFNIYTNGIRYNAVLRWSGTNWQYRNSSGDFVNMTGLTYFGYGQSTSGYDYWINLSIKLDLSQKKYLTASVNENLFDLERAPIWYSPVAGINYMQFKAVLTTLENAQKEMWIDNAQITMV